MAETFIIQEERARIDDIIDEVGVGWTKLADGEDGQMWVVGGMRVIWSVAIEMDGRVWMHVSMSRLNQLPTYHDQKRVKGLFIGEDRWAYSVWSPSAQHVNLHSNVLHLWAPLTGEPPLPDFARGGASI